tara:strand:- start:856 stop:2076 length:1221 start_codon:yes stop_codon:yes gene_type:complete
VLNETSRLSQTINTIGFVPAWIIGGISSFCRFFEVLVSAYIIFKLSDSALLVALNSGLRVAPLLVVGWIIGRYADKLDKRIFINLSTIIFIFSSFSAFILMITNFIEVWHLLSLSFLSGLGWAFEFPSRRSFMGDILKKSNISLGIGLDLTISNFGRFIGPIIAGLMIDYFIDYSFVFSGSFYFFSFLMSLLIFRLTKRNNFEKEIEEEEVSNPFKSLIKNHMFRTVLVVTIVCNIWAFPTTSMVPVIGETVLKINPTLLGILVGAEGAGCLIGSLLIAGVKDRKLQSILFISGSFIFFISIFIFSISDIYLLSLILLFLGGLGVAGFSTMQSVIIVDRTSSNLRGSAMGFLSTTIGMQPFGALNVGIICSIFLPEIGIRISALQGIVLMIILLLISEFWQKKYLN